MHKLLLNTSFIGQEIVFLPECQSTNQIALQMCEKKSPKEGLTVLTFHQTAGRGQRGNTWQSEGGKNLTFSVVLKPGFLAISSQFYLNIIASLAVYEFFSSFLKKELKIKWPNDILFKEKKICGILIENILRGSKMEYSVVGMGLNINQEQFDYPKASSLKNFTGQTYNLEVLVAALLEQFEKQYILLREGRFELLKAEYLQKLFRFGEKHLYQSVEGNFFEGTIKDVQHEGRLFVEVAGQLKAFDFKEIQFVFGK